MRMPKTAAEPAASGGAAGTATGNGSDGDEAPGEAGVPEPGSPQAWAPRARVPEEPQAAEPTAAPLPAVEPRASDPKAPQAQAQQEHASEPWAAPSLASGSQASQAATQEARSGEAEASKARPSETQVGQAKAGLRAGQAPASQAPASQPKASQAPAHSRRPLPLLRRNWLAALLLTLGLALRVLVQVSYSPALLYIDTVKYLYNAWPAADPLGYNLPLRGILLVGNLNTVAAIQHLLGLGMAVTLYLVLLRRGVPRWLAALAMAPVLLDAYQLQTEATIMPDVWFEAMILAGLAVLLWRPRPSVRMCILAGVILGLSATVRQVGEILVLPALIFVLFAAGGWRQVLKKAAALIIAFAVPIVAYCSGSLALTGHFWLSRNGYQATYGRMAGLADCATLKLPSYARVLCPTPSQQAMGADWLDHATDAPLHNYVGPPDIKRSAIIGNFNRAVVTQQPLRVVGRISSDAIKLFSVTRVTRQGDTAISRWQFHPTYPTYSPTIITDKQGTVIFGLKPATSRGALVYRKLDASYGGNVHVWTPGSRFLTGYMHDGGYTPGPLLLLCFVAGLAGALTVFRRRASPAQRQLALGAVLFTTGAIAILIMSDLFEFSWRYQLPALVTLPPAGAIGIAAVLRFTKRRTSGRASGSAEQAQQIAARTG